MRSLLSPLTEDRSRIGFVVTVLAVAGLASLLALILAARGVLPGPLSVALAALALAGPALARGALLTGRRGWMIGMQVVSLAQASLVIASTPATVELPNRMLRLAIVLAVAAGTASLALGFARPRALGRALAIGTGIPAALFVADFVVRDPIVREPPGRPEWRATMVPDSLLGERYLPDTGFVSTYPDDGGGDHDATDFRARLWELNLFEGNEANLRFPAEARSEVRIGIVAADSGPGWHIQLNQSGLAVKALAGYSVHLRLRADSARAVSIGFLQAHAPWTPIGFYRTITVDTAWRDFDEYFIAGMDDDDTRLSLDLGGSGVSVALADVRIEDERGIPQGPSLPLDRYEVRYRMNAAGCRGHDVDDADSTQRVLVLGDGDAMGLGVRESDTFARRLETAHPADTTAAEAGRIRTVFNCAQPGDATNRAVARYRALASRYHPTTVMLVLGPETLQRVAHQATAIAQARVPSALRLSSTLARLFPARPRQRAQATSRVAGQVGELARAIEDGGGHLIVAFFRTTQDREWSSLIAAVADTLRGRSATVADLGTDLVDRVPETRLLGSDPGRPNATAHRLAADALDSRLEAANASSRGSP